MLSSVAIAQASISGSNLAFQSNGNNQIPSTGYVGTYLNVPDLGDGGSLVNLTLNATRGFGSGTPHINIVVADSKFGFNVTSPGMQDYSTGDFWMPAGMHFVRVERDSQSNIPSAVNRNLTVNNLEATGSTFSNVNNRTHALQAANTYIEHFRQGKMTLGLSGVTSGKEVHVKQVSRDFQFGTAVAGVSPNNVNSFLDDTNYTSRLLENFNTVVPENAGKWAHSQPFFDIQGMDAILQFAEQNNLRARMHNLIWQNQQPGSINNLINDALDGNTSAKNQLRQAISDRIAYYVGDRAHGYIELDVLNEALRAPAYWNVFTPTEVAGIYAEVRDAAASAGAEVGLYINDFNILQHNNDPETNQSDDYANWHRQHGELLNNSGFGEVVSGIGIQYYVRHDGSVSVPRMQQVFQNMAVTGLPLSLTEFGVQTFGNPSPEQSADYLEETMRMVFGAPHATTFMMWGFWEGAIWSGGPLAALYDTNWNLTVPGERYQQLMDEWTTEKTLAVGPGGLLQFRGFFGDYEITIDGETYEVSFGNGSELAVIVVAPGDYNGDGVVDAADYVVWRRAIGSDSDLRADGNGDGIIDALDFEIWRQHFGTSYSSGAAGHAQGSAAVPEPASVGLILLAIVFLGARQRNKRVSFGISLAVGRLQH